jgi:hypothetical protein
MMCTPHWITSRWRQPKAARQEKTKKLFASTSLNVPLFGSDFIEALEKKQSELEKIRWAQMMIQVPIFLFLAFSLIDFNDVTVTFLGVSSSAAGGLREILLLASATVGFYFLVTEHRLIKIQEILNAHVAHLSQGKEALVKEFLETRFSQQLWIPKGAPSDTTGSTSIDKIASAIFCVSMITGFVILGTICLIVLALNLNQIFINPHYGYWASSFVALYVGLFLLAQAALWLLARFVRVI